jgi:hypothetical protein
LLVPEPTSAWTVTGGTETGGTETDGVETVGVETGGTPIDGTVIPGIPIDGIEMPGIPIDGIEMPTVMDRTDAPRTRAGAADEGAAQATGTAARAMLSAAVRRPTRATSVSSTAAAFGLTRRLAL